MINEFLAMMSKRSHAKQSLFIVELVGLPSALLSVQGLNEMQRDMRFFASTVDVPGTQLLTQEHRYYDLQQKFVYGKVHEDLVITFRLDKDWLVKKLLDKWVDCAYNSNTGNVYYKEDYNGTIQISPFMENGTSPYSVLLEEAFPTSVGAVSMSWESAGQFAQIPITFSFRRTKVTLRSAVFTNTTISPSTQAQQFDAINTSSSSSMIKDNVNNSIYNSLIDDRFSKIINFNTHLKSDIIKTIF